ncbi:MAG TPA: endolytic transglycosylase MltG [Bacteroidia bacterium]|nr:endolytic transglycosylase MltG [Bacteroidia bacterium]
MSGSVKKKISAALLVVAIVAGTGFYIFYRAFYSSQITVPDKSKLIYIHTGWDFEKVVTMLEEKHIIKNPKLFRFVAGVKKYKDHIKPGRYRVVNGMSNTQLVNLLNSGKQEVETVSLYNIRTKYDLAGIIAGKMESDSSTIMGYFDDNDNLKKIGFNQNNIIAMFIPGTYQLLWTDTPEAFMKQMHDTYEAFWTKDRRRLAQEAKLSPLQVSVLASIVQAEQSMYAEEKPIIAGLYINRLHQGMALQSDPTLVYCRGDFTIMRVRNGDKLIDSPYNTYTHTGLPPGPINMPEASSIDAVLHYDHNDYIYMCAEASFSGKHHFSKTYKEQQTYASKYHHAENNHQIIR